MQLAHIFFWLLAAGAILTSVLVVFPRGRNPLYGAFALIVSFVFMAGMYVLLVAHTMAVLQILVYAGAIMVLFMFVIMLLNLSPRELGQETKTLAMGLGVGATAFIAYEGIKLVATSADGLGRESAQLADNFGTIEAIGESLFREHLVPFELASVLLLVAIVGAVVLAKRTL